MAPRTFIRHKDIRLVTDDLSTPGFDRNENDYARSRYFEANCLAGHTVGDFVYISAAPSGGLFTTAPVDLTDASTFPAVGILMEKSSPTQCFVQREGIISVSAFPSSIILTVGAKYWIGSDSQLTSTVPVPSTGVFMIQLVGQALSTTELILAQGILPLKRRA